MSEFVSIFKLLVIKFIELVMKFVMILIVNNLKLMNSMY